LQQNTKKGYDNCCHLFCSNTNKKKGDGNKLVAITHCHFKQKEKKMGDDNKLVVVALFVVTTR
jgi:hypothetical protein